MRVLVACEFSGTVRDAFGALGHDATSCDLLPTARPGKHYQGDVFDIINDGWDLMIAHPPCTHLAVSGAMHFARKVADGSQQAALEFVEQLFAAPIKKKAIENPVSIISSRIKKPSQIIQPWQFGHAERKTTCLWLEGLPLLTPTNNVQAEMRAKPPNRQNPLYQLPPSPDRWMLRSKTYQGIADAMAAQWGTSSPVTPPLKD